MRLKHAVATSRLPAAPYGWLYLRHIQFLRACLLETRSLLSRFENFNQGHDVLLNVTLCSLLEFSQRDNSHPKQSERQVREGRHCPLEGMTLAVGYTFIHF